MHALITSIRSFLLYSNVIVTAAAAMMAFRAFRLFGLPPDLYIIAMVAAATLAVYAWHSMSPDDRPGSARDNWNRAARYFHRSCLTVSFITLIFLLPQITGHALALVPAILLTAYYMSAGMLKFPIHGKTMVLALTWTYATMLMPLILSGYSVCWPVILPPFILEFVYIYLICLFFDHRDAAVDKPRHWTFRTTARIRAVISLTAIAFMIAMAWAWTAGVSQPWLIVKTGLMLCLVVTSGYTLRSHNDGWYYGVLDGMLAFDALFLCFSVTNDG